LFDDVPAIDQGSIKGGVKSIESIKSIKSIKSIESIESIHIHSHPSYQKKSVRAFSLL
jgi:hypothetical protein